MGPEPWYKEGLRFTCTQCGNCCSGPPGYVWVTQSEIEAIDEFLGRPDGSLTEDYVRRVGLKRSLLEKSGGDCIFLRRANGKATCSIYPVRPLQCRTWPFWNQNLAAKEAWEQASRTCPGMNHGAFHNFVAVEEVRLRNAWE